MPAMSKEEAKGIVSQRHPAELTDMAIRSRDAAMLLTLLEEIDRREIAFAALEGVELATDPTAPAGSLGRERCQAALDSCLVSAARLGFDEGVGKLAPVCDAKGMVAGESALMAAASRGQAECVRILLPFSDPMALDAEGQSALHRAAMAKSVECVELLLGFDASTPGSGAGTALHTMLKIAKNEASFVSVVQEAVSGDEEEIDPRTEPCLRLLASRGRLEEEDLFGHTPLMLAAKTNCARWTKILLDAGADPRRQNTSGHSALLVALMDDCAPIVALLAPLSDLHACDRAGKTALDWAVDSRRANAIETMFEAIGNERARALMADHPNELWLRLAPKTVARIEAEEIERSALAGELEKTSKNPGAARPPSKPRAL
jgi:hypothetical protein